MKYNVGDKVRIKNIDWYNENKDSHGNVVVLSKVPHFFLREYVQTVFTKDMAKFCGKVVTIETVWDVNYSIVEGTHRDYFTDEMIEGLVEEEVKPEPKFKVGDKVILDPYPCVVTDVNWRDSLHGFVYTVRGTDFGKMVGEEDLTFDTSEEETPKFKINDIVFVKNIGWVRITNSYWDSLANEYIYEAIGFNGEGEYDSINQSNIEDQMLPESENPHTGGNKITLDEYKNNDKEWLFNKLAMLDNITALESIQDIFNYLQQSKYPKTYEECCRVLGVSEFEYNHTGTKMWYRHKLMATLDNLMLCRDAYWKLAGEEMGLGKPWEPDWKECKYPSHCIIVEFDNFKHLSHILAFPTPEMRDVFYENFKEEIEICKELL